MTNNDGSAGVTGRINQFKIVVLALLASLAIMLVGFTASATDDTRGYGIVQTDQTAIVSGGQTTGSR